MPLTRDQAQQRADDIQAFRREAQRLQAEHAWPLDDAPLAQIAAHHEQLLAQYRAGFDIDPDQQSKRLSLSMRIVSLLGALALAASLLFFFYQFWGLFGEATQVAILLGFVYLLIRKTISWRIPVVMVASFMLFSLLFGQDPVTGVLSGGLLFGAVFMATDYVTSPMTALGQILYAAGAGLIVALIRAFGGYPEGVTYAILLMNIATPLIDRSIRPRIYGEVKQRA